MLEGVIGELDWAGLLLLQAKRSIFSCEQGARVDGQRVVVDTPDRVKLVGELLPLTAIGFGLRMSFALPTCLRRRESTSKQTIIS